MLLDGNVCRFMNMHNGRERFKWVGKEERGAGVEEEREG